jgi:hypothetical protein
MKVNAARYLPVASRFFSIGDETETIDWNLLIALQ